MITKALLNIDCKLGGKPEQTSEVNFPASRLPSLLKNHQKSQPKDHGLCARIPGTALLQEFQHEGQKVRLAVCPTH